VVLVAILVTILVALVVLDLLEIHLEVLPASVVADVSVAALVDLMMMMTMTSVTKPLGSSKISSGSKAIGPLYLYAFPNRKASLEIIIVRQGAIITAVAVTALGFPELSQSHWVARAFWISSLVTALLAVYYAGNLVWKVGRLFSGSEIRTWLRGNNQGIQDILGGEEIRHGILKTLTPALSSVLIVSAPGLLFSASVLCLLLGFGIYLGFVWTRALDTASGHGDSRSVFIVYLLVIAVFYVVYSLSDIVQDYGTGVTVGDIIMKSVEKLQTEWPKFVEAREKRKIREYEEHQNRIRQPELLETILRLGDETSQHLTAIAVELQKAQEWREKGQEVR